MAAVQRLRDDVAELAHAGGRKPGTLGHRRVEHYLVERLLTVGLSPYRGDEFRLPFEIPRELRRGGVTEGMNLVAVARGTNRDAPRCCSAPTTTACWRRPVPTTTPRRWRSCWRWRWNWSPAR